METAGEVISRVNPTELSAYRPETLVQTEDGRKAIAAMQGHRLRDMPTDECFRDVQRLIRFIAVQVGCGIPSGEQEYRKAALRMMQHLTGYYGDMTVAEVKTAFELFSAGRLDQYFQQGIGGGKERPKHYGQLSPAYVSEVLNAYCTVRNRAVYVDEMTRPVAYTSRISPEERERNDAQCRAWLCDAYDEWLNKGDIQFPTIATAKVYRDILVKDGLASPETCPVERAVTEGFTNIRASGKDVRETVLF